MKLSGFCNNFFCNGTQSHWSMCFDKRLQHRQQFGRIFTDMIKSSAYRTFVKCSSVATHPSHIGGFEISIFAAHVQIQHCKARADNIPLFDPSFDTKCRFPETERTCSQNMVESLGQSYNGTPQRRFKLIVSKMVKASVTLVPGRKPT